MRSSIINPQPDIPPAEPEACDEERRDKWQARAHLVIVIDDYVLARQLEHDFMASQLFDVQVSARLNVADGAAAAREQGITAILIAQHCALGGVTALRRAGVTCPIFLLAGELVEEDRAWLLATGFDEAVALPELNADVIDSLVLLGLQLRRRQLEAAESDAHRIVEAA